MSIKTRSLPSLLLFLAIAAALLAVELWIVNTAGFAAQPAMVSLAVTLDIVIGAPLLFYLLVVRRKRLPLITLAPVFVLSLIIAGRILPPAQRTHLNGIELAVPFVELAVLAVVAFKLRQIIHHYRGLRPGFAYAPETLEASLRSTVPTFPPLVVSIFSTEVSLISFGFAGWLRRAPKTAGATLRFSYHRQGGYALILGFIAFLVLLETTVAHLLLARWSESAAWVLTALSIYTLIWLFGDYHASRLQPIVLGDTHLHLRTGMRWRVDTPWQQVAGLDKISQADKKAPDYLNLAPIGEPQLALRLSEPVAVHGLLGRVRFAHVIGLSVDAPVAFTAAVAQRSVAGRD